MRLHNLQVTTVSVDEISQHPDNANNGDVEAIVESIEVNGFFQPILVQRSTGYIIAGNHRYVAALDLGAPVLPVIYLDVTDAEAKRLMIVDNRTARLGRDDEAQLKDLLAELYASDIGLAGTGYDYQLLEQLRTEDEIPLEFAAPPVPDVVEGPAETPKYRMPFVVMPMKDEQGEVIEVNLLREDFGRITLADYQNIRRALGLKPAPKDEIASYEVPSWR